MSEYVKEIKKELRSLVAPVIERRGMRLVDLVFSPRRGGRGLLRLIIDQDGGVDVEDCASVSREVSDLLDVKEEIIPGSYNLEVSSPGLNRPLVNRDDFEEQLGEEVSVRLYTPIAGRRNFKGMLKGVAEDTLVMEVDGREHRLPLDDLEKANLVYRFD